MAPLTDRDWLGFAPTRAAMSLMRSHGSTYDTSVLVSDIEIVTGSHSSSLVIAHLPLLLLPLWLGAISTR